MGFCRLLTFTMEERSDSPPMQRSTRLMRNHLPLLGIRTFRYMLALIIVVLCFVIYTSIYASNAFVTSTTIDTKEGYECGQTESYFHTSVHKDPANKFSMVSSC